MRIGVIGTGVMGSNHVRVYSELKTVDKLYVYDMYEETANKMKEYGAIVCKTIDELLETVDAVSICVPSSRHFDIAKETIKKGRHCLIEKPITSTVQEGERLLDILKNKRLIVGVGHIERYNPIMGEIKKILEKPVYIEIKRHNPSSMRMTDISVVEDLMIHDIDIVFNVLFNSRKYQMFSSGNEGFCSALIKFDESTVFISACKTSCKKTRTIYIEDEKFTIEGDFMRQEIYIHRKPQKFDYAPLGYIQENVIEKVLVNKLEPLKAELKTFVDCVLNGKEFPITPRQAVENLKICEEIKKCM